MVMSRAAKQSRTHDTTVCYIHEQSILIERSLKAYYEKFPYEQTMRVAKTTLYHLLYNVNTKQIYTHSFYLVIPLGMLTNLLYSSPSPSHTH